MISMMVNLRKIYRFQGGGLIYAEIGYIFRTDSNLVKNDEPLAVSLSSPQF